MSEAQLKSASFSDLDKSTLYKILQLRSEVFVLEQECIYLDLDGRDTNPSTDHIWIEENGAVLAVVRVLRMPNGDARLGRVCTKKDARGRGLAGQLVKYVCDTEQSDVTANCQSYLKDWYEGFGFVVEGEELLEDKIPHLPMRLKR